MYRKSCPPRPPRYEALPSEIPTPQATQLLREVCEFWSQTCPVEYDETHGKITLPKAYVTLMSSPQTLSVYVETTVAADQDSVEDNVAGQIQRFAAGKDVPCRWLRD